METRACDSYPGIGWLPSLTYVSMLMMVSVWKYVYMHSSTIYWWWFFVTIIFILIMRCLLGICRLWRFYPLCHFWKGVAMLRDILGEGCPHPLGHSHGVLWTNYLQPCDRYNLIKIRCLMYLIFLSWLRRRCIAR